MKKLGIISEFNPFHNGHEYLLKKSKEKTGADLAISLMSGDYVQRGEPAVVNKFARAHAAILAGFDMVVEMPTHISLQSAEYFALGSIKILEKIGIDYLCFGIENEDPKIFLEKSRELIYRADELEALTKKNLVNSSYTKARYDATVEILGDKDFITSNNILALEYLRAIDKICSNIKAIPIRRISSANKDMDLKTSKISSSTAIRKNIYKDYKDHVPSYSYKLIEDEKDKFGFPSMDYEYGLFKFLLLIEKKPMTEIIGYEEGIDNYLASLAKINFSFDSFIDQASTKRYTSARIKRLMINYILSNETSLNNIDLDFYKILALNPKARYILKNSKSIPIIRKKDTNKLSKTDLIILSKIIDASNLYNIGLGGVLDQDFSKKI